MFCPKCKTMMIPKTEKDGKYYVCRNEDCGYKEPIKGIETIASSRPEGGDIAIVSGDVVTQPKTRDVRCPYCGYAEATYTIQQTRSADEPPTTIYRCCNPKCYKTWREY